MKPRPGIRKFVKWVGTAMCAIVAGAWLVSTWFWADWRSVDGPAVGIGQGRIYFQFWWVKPDEQTPPGWHWNSTPARAEWRMYISRLNPGVEGSIHLWVVTSALLFPALAAFRLDTLARRRARSGLCAKCRYDRAGIPPTSPCPECGAAPAAPVESPQ